jgi:hypothetical protein
MSARWLRAKSGVRQAAQLIQPPFSNCYIAIEGHDTPNAREGHERSTRNRIAALDGVADGGVGAGER